MFLHIDIKIKIIFLYCVNCFNMKNLYHIHVIIDKTHNSWKGEKRKYNRFLFYLFIQAEVKLENLLNLSILISKGKEINWDCLSNGEWTGISSLLKRIVFIYDMHCSIWGGFCRIPVRVSSFDQDFYHRRC